MFQVGDYTASKPLFHRASYLADVFKNENIERKSPPPNASRNVIEHALNQFSRSELAANAISEERPRMAELGRAIPESKRDVMEETERLMAIIAIKQQRPRRSATFQNKS